MAGEPGTHFQQSLKDGRSRGHGHHTRAGSAILLQYHHTAADTLDKVNPRHLAENAAVIAVTAYALADASNPPPALSGRTSASGLKGIYYPDLASTGSSLPERRYLATVIPTL